MWQYNQTSEIYHHGVKGMHWGVVKEVSDEELREYRQEMITRYDKKADKKQFYENATETQMQDDIKRRQTTKKIIVAAAATAAIGVGVYAAYKYNVFNNIKSLSKTSSDLSSDDIVKKAMKDGFDDLDIVLEKGSSIHRMSSYKDIDFSKISDPTYVSYKDKDVLKYMSMLKDWNGTGERYDILLEATKDIKMPSEKKARAIFNDLWNNNPEYKEKLQNSIIKTYENFYDSPKVAKEEAIKSIKDNPFKMGVFSIVRKNEDSKIFLNKITSAGYDAIEDYFDKGSFTDSPVILLDPSSSIIKKGETFVTEEMKKEAFSKVMFF